MIPTLQSYHIHYGNMDTINKTYFLGMALFVLIFTFLIAQRFDETPRLEVTVTAQDGELNYKISEELKRGTFVETADDFLKLQIGDTITIALDHNSQIELEDLRVEGPTVRLYKGRVVARSISTPIFITTNTTETTVLDASATFVNYDFLQTVHLIPMEGTIQTYLKSTQDDLYLPVPISVSEGEAPGYESLEVNLQAPSVLEFYQWEQTH